MKAGALSSETAQAAPWLAGGRIPALDGLRAVAVLLVLVSHVQLTNGFPRLGLTRFVDRVGTVGVDVFFVLSGFLITSLLCRELERSQRISLRAFYVRRALRILPAYLTFLVFVGLLSMSGRAQVSRGDWLAAATYTMNFRDQPAWEVGHIWSLSIEEHFYLLWPPLFAFLPRRTAVVGLSSVLLVEPFLRAAVLLWSPARAIQVELWTFTRLDPIAAGCLLALLSRTPAGFAFLNRTTRFWPVALGTLGLALVGSLESGKFDVDLAPSMIALSLALLVWAAVQRAPRLLETPTFIAIGLGSYSLYLWQEVFLNPHRGEWWAAFPQNLVLVVLFAVFSYRVIERPFLRLKQRQAHG